MRIILLPLLGCLVSCTTIPTPYGKARFWGDYGTVDLKSGPVHFVATDMKHSPAARAHWRGASAVASQVVAGAASIAQPAVGAGAAIIGPAVAPRTP